MQSVVLSCRTHYTTFTMFTDLENTRSNTKGLVSNQLNAANVHEGDILKLVVMHQFAVCQPPIKFKDYLLSAQICTWMFLIDDF